MALEGELSISLELLDSLLFKVLGGKEGEDMNQLFSGLSKAQVARKIDNDVSPRKVQFVAYHPRGKTGTAICTSLDGSIYDADDDNIPAIPQHFNCRSQYKFLSGVL